MRLIEAVLLITDAMVLFLLCGSSYPLSLPLKGVAAVPLTIATILMACAGSRWQIAPGLLIAVMILAIGSWCRPVPWVVAGGMVTLIGTASLCIVLPVFILPEPTGPYHIGVISRHLKDSNREDPRADSPEAGRELVIDIWYPAERAGTPVPYRSRPETTLLSSHFCLVPTHASAGAPVASKAGRLPVILYCSSWMGRRGLNTVQVEDLASRGFLVVTIDHPYGSAIVSFPDGRVTRSRLAGFLDGETAEAVEVSRRAVNAELKTWSADVSFVIDELQRLDRSDPEGLLRGRVDLERVGIFGYSFGGAVASEASLKDPRIKAVVNYDGMLFGAAAEAGVECPYLYVSYDLPTASRIDHSHPSPSPGMSGEAWRDLLMADDVENVRRSLMRHGGAVLLIPQANHSLFCDESLFTPLKRHQLANRIQRVVTDVTSAFFERCLLPDGPDLLAHAAAKDPIAQLQTYRPSR